MRSRRRLAHPPPSPATSTLTNEVPRHDPAHGEGDEPHVDDVAGRLIYSLPVASSIVSVSFSLRERDLDLQLDDPWRCALLGVIAHKVLRRLMIRGNLEVTDVDVAGMVDAMLHSTPEASRAFVADVDRDHNIGVEQFARAAMGRRA